MSPPWRLTKNKYKTLHIFIMFEYNMAINRQDWKLILKMLISLQKGTLKKYKFTNQFLDVWKRRRSQFTLLWSINSLQTHSNKPDQVLLISTLFLALFDTHFVFWKDLWEVIVALFVYRVLWVQVLQIRDSQKHTAESNILFLANI